MADPGGLLVEAAGKGLSRAMLDINLEGTLVSLVGNKFDSGTLVTAQELGAWTRDQPVSPPWSSDWRR